MISNLAGKPKIFIGSSGKSYELVKWLAEQIRSCDIAIPVEWKAGGFAPSKSTLQNLIEQCKVCDFAVIFFTRDDDKSSPDSGKSNPLKIFKGPRDNTIFEAGLFVGGLGLEPERCILVSSVDESALPSDIKGVTYIEIEEPPPPDPPYNRLSPDWCRENLQIVFESVVYSGNHYGEFLNRPLLKVFTRRQLAEREQVGKNCLEKYDRVVVNSSEPEDCCEFVLARAVSDNIKQHVYYDFHFRVSNENDKNVSSQLIDLIRILLASYLICNENYTEGDLKKERDIKEFLETKADQNEEIINQAFEDFRKQLRFYIHKYKHPIPFRISIHNVSSFDRAKCYLRHEDYFVEWFLREEAREAIDILKNVYYDKKDESIYRIFQSTDTFDLYTSRDSKDCIKDNKSLKEVINKNIDNCNMNEDYDKDTLIQNINAALNKYCINDNKELTFRKMLIQKIMDLFPQQLWERIKDLCFGQNNDLIEKEWEKIIPVSEDTAKRDKPIVSVMVKIPAVKDSSYFFEVNNELLKYDSNLPVVIYGEDNSVMGFLNRDIFYKKNSKYNSSDVFEKISYHMNNLLLRSTHNISHIYEKDLTYMNYRNKIQTSSIPFFILAENDSIIFFVNLDIHKLFSNFFNVYFNNIIDNSIFIRNLITLQSDDTLEHIKIILDCKIDKNDKYPLFYYQDNTVIDGIIIDRLRFDTYYNNLSKCTLSEISDNFTIYKESELSKTPVFSEHSTLKDIKCELLFFEHLKVAFVNDDINNLIFSFNTHDFNELLNNLITPDYFKRELLNECYIFTINDLPDSDNLDSNLLTFFQIDNSKDILINIDTIKFIDKIKEFYSTKISDCQGSVFTPYSVYSLDTTIKEIIENIHENRKQMVFIYNENNILQWELIVEELNNVISDLSNQKLKNFQDKLLRDIPEILSENDSNLYTLNKISSYSDDQQIPIINNAGQIVKTLDKNKFISYCIDQIKAQQTDSYVEAFSMKSLKQYDIYDKLCNNKSKNYFFIISDPDEFKKVLNNDGFNKNYSDLLQSLIINTNIIIQQNIIFIYSDDSIDTIDSKLNNNNYYFCFVKDMQVMGEFSISAYKFLSFDMPFRKFKDKVVSVSDTFLSINVKSTLYESIEILSNKENKPIKFLSGNKIEFIDKDRVWTIIDDFFRKNLVEAFKKHLNSENNKLIFDTDTFKVAKKKLQDLSKDNQYKPLILGPDNTIIGIPDEKVIEELSELIPDKKIQDYLQNIVEKETKDGIAAYISKSRTVSFAKEIFKSTSQCKYIFITENGQRDEEIYGIVTRDILISSPY